MNSAISVCWSEHDRAKETRSQGRNVTKTNFVSGRLINMRMILLFVLGGALLSIGCQSTPVQSEANSQDVAATPPALQSQTAPEASSNSSKAATVKRQKRAVKSAKAFASNEPSVQASVPASPAPETYTLAAQTDIPVRLIDAVSTETNKAGDTFLASLAEPLTLNGVTLFPKDTSVQGKIVSLAEPGRVSGVASISLQLTEIQPANGSPVPLQTQPFSETAKSQKKKDAAIIGAGAGVGTAIGAIAGGKKGAMLGAIAGGGGGTGYVLATKGQQLKYPSETLMTFKLAEPLTVTR
jgi:hypothetical protein